MAITYHCDECGAEAPDGACPDHPRARVSSIIDRPITNAQIEALSNEAGQSGDLEMVAICERALNGSARARKACEKAIRWARAQQ